MGVHGAPAANPRRIRGTAVYIFIGMLPFLETRHTGFSQLLACENVGGFLETACADGPAAVTGAKPQGQPWS